MTEVAKRMGMLYNTFYSRINGRVVFSPEEVRDLVAAAPDRRFLEYLVDGTPFCIELRAVEEMTHANPGTEAFHKLSCACGLLESAKSLLDETEDAIVDRVALCGAVERSKRVLTDLRRCLVADS